jgi:hypothetical protein
MPASESQISFPDPFYTDPTFLNALLAILDPFVTEAEVSKCKISIDNCFKSRNCGYSARLLAKPRLFVLERETGTLLYCLTNLYHILGVVLSLVHLVIGRVFAFAILLSSTVNKNIK